MIPISKSILNEQRANKWQALSMNIFYLHHRVRSLILLTIFCMLAAPKPDLSTLCCHAISLFKASGMAETYRASWVRHTEPMIRIEFYETKIIHLILYWPPNYEDHIWQVAGPELLEIQFFWSFCELWEAVAQNPYPYSWGLAIFELSSARSNQ